jgi:hypothetical protein
MRRIMLTFMFLMAFTFMLITGCTTETRVIEKAVPCREKRAYRGEGANSGSEGSAASDSKGSATGAPCTHR